MSSTLLLPHAHSFVKGPAVINTHGSFGLYYKIQNTEYRVRFPGPPDVAVVIHLNNFLGPVDDTVTALPQSPCHQVTKREEPGKTGAPCVKVPGSSRVPAPPWVGSRSPDGWDQIPRPIGLVVGSYTNHPGVLGSIPKREEPGKTGAPCVKVPGSSRVPVRDEQTHPHRPRLVVSHSTCPPLSSPPHTNSFVIGPAVIKHTRSPA